MLLRLRELKPPHMTEGSASILIQLQKVKSIKLKDINTNNPRWIIRRLKVWPLMLKHAGYRTKETQ